jgi:uridine phosphorylase
MTKKIFTPEHMNANADDMKGNDGIGRYCFLPGSDGRAKEIADHFDNVVLKPHPRGHNLYLGTLSSDGKKIDVAVISSGMGCPSMEIILHELFYLGAKRFLRIGTAGSLRDENTTTNYVPLEVPAIASLEFNSSILLAAEKVELANKLHTGIVHCKSSLYAREFGAGPQSKENEAYLNLLTLAGVLASEMETSTLFIQSQLYNHQLEQQGQGPQHRVLAGAILGIIATPNQKFEKSQRAHTAISNSIILALETIKTLAVQELFH